MTRTVENPYKSLEPIADDIFGKPPTQPTPQGPWKAERCVSNKYFIYDADGSCIAVAYSKHGSTELSAHATAALIIAAPELLEALKAVVSVADRKTVEFDMAHIAIANAERGL